MEQQKVDQYTQYKQEYENIKKFLDDTVPEEIRQKARKQDKLWFFKKIQIEKRFITKLFGNHYYTENLYLDETVQKRIFEVLEDRMKELERLMEEL